MSSKCLKCGGTGITVDGLPCDCREHGKVNVPLVLEIPAIYQNVEFSALLLPPDIDKSYGLELEGIIDRILKTGTYPVNLLICSPPNHGKTVFAYSVVRAQYMKGLPIPEVMDIIEAKELMFSNSYNEDTILRKDKLVKSSVAIIKLPLDLPAKFAETMSTIIERRVRNGGVTIFLYGNRVSALRAQDKYGTLSSIIRDGSYNSLKVIEYFPKFEEEVNA